MVRDGKDGKDGDFVIKEEGTTRSDAVARRHVAFPHSLYGPTSWRFGMSLFPVHFRA